MMTIIIVAVTIMIKMADSIRQMKGITLMLLLTVSTAHIFKFESHVTCSSGIIIKNLDGKSTEQSVSTDNKKMYKFTSFYMLITG